MKVAVEISMYPLSQDYEPPIVAFIKELKKVEGLQVVTNELSTQVAGDYELAMDTIKTAIHSTFTTVGTCSFVLKVLNVDIQPGKAVEI